MTEQFTTWLRRQAHRDDPVGDLARDYMDDKCAPRFASADELMAHIKMGGPGHSRDTHDAQAALVRAAREFMAQGLDPFTRELIRQCDAAFIVVAR